MDYSKMVKHPLYRQDLQQVLDAVKDVHRLFQKKIYIAGATGLIGSYLVDVLLYANEVMDAGITVYAAGRSMQRLDNRFFYSQDEKLHLVEQDVIETLKEKPEADYIIHGASNAYPAAFRKYPAETLMSNVLGTKRLLDYAVEKGARRFLYISSGEVYGEGEPGSQGYRETESGYVNPMEVRSCYPNGKRAAETLCAAYGEEHGVDAVVVRPCHTYGPNATGADNRANVQFVNEALAGHDIIMHSKGEHIRSYCYIADCVSGILTVLLDGIAGNAYNIANKHAITTIAGFAREVAVQTGRQVRFELPDDTLQKEQTKITKAVLDSSLLESLGWIGEYEVKKGINHTLRILKEV